jgi:hypothetical protein
MISREIIVGRWKVSKTDRPTPESGLPGSLGSTFEFRDTGDVVINIAGEKRMIQRFHFEVKGQMIRFWDDRRFDRSVIVSEEGGLLKLTAPDDRSDWLERM